MEQITSKSTNWNEGEWQEATNEPGVSVSAVLVEEELPTLTAAAIVGVTLLIIVTIAALFILGVLIDCRQQRVMAQQLSEAKRLKGQRRSRVVPSVPESDSVNITLHMEEAGISLPPSLAPSDAVLNIP